MVICPLRGLRVHDFVDNAPTRSNSNQLWQSRARFLAELSCVPSFICHTWHVPTRSSDLYPSAACPPTCLLRAALLALCNHHRLLRLPLGSGCSSSQTAINPEHRRAQMVSVGKHTCAAHDSPGRRMLPPRQQHSWHAKSWHMNGIQAQVCLEQLCEHYPFSNLFSEGFASWHSGARQHDWRVCCRPPLACAVHANVVQLTIDLQGCM